MPREICKITTAVGLLDVTRDLITVGALDFVIARQGGATTTITSPSAGTYDLDIKASADVQRISVNADENVVLTSSNEFILTIDNSANSFDRKFSVQIRSNTTEAIVDMHVLGIAPTIGYLGNVTTLTFPNMNGFKTGAETGFEIELR